MLYYDILGYIIPHYITSNYPMYTVLHSIFSNYTISYCELLNSLSQHHIILQPLMQYDMPCCTSYVHELMRYVIKPIRYCTAHCILSLVLLHYTVLFSCSTISCYTVLDSSISYCICRSRPGPQPCNMGQGFYLRARRGQPSDIMVVACTKPPYVHS